MHGTGQAYTLRPLLVHKHHMNTMNRGRWPMLRREAGLHACLTLEVWWPPLSSHAADAGGVMQVSMYLDDGSPTPSYPVAGQEYMQLKLGDVVEVVLQNNAAWLNGTASHPAILQSCAVVSLVPADWGCLGWVQPASM